MYFSSGCLWLDNNNNLIINNCWVERTWVKLYIIALTSHLLVSCSLNHPRACNQACVWAAASSLPGWTRPDFAANQSLGTGPGQKFATSCRYQSEHHQSSRLSHAECVQIQLLLRQIQHHKHYNYLHSTIQHTTVVLQSQLSVSDEPCEPHSDVVGIISSLDLRIIGIRYAKPMEGKTLVCLFIPAYLTIISSLLLPSICNINTRNNQLGVQWRFFVEAVKIFLLNLNVFILK